MFLTPYPVHTGAVPTSADSCQPSAGLDARAVEAMVLRYRPLALSVARRYRGAGYQREDLEQVACEGLIKAVRRFDPDRGCAFSSFAVPTILGELRRFCRDTGWSAHVPRAMQERALAVRKVGDELSADGRHPTVDDLASFLGWAEEEVLEALSASSTRATVPLEGPMEESAGGATPIERLGAVDPGFDRVECLAAIETSLGALSAPEKQVLRLRFEDDLPLHEIAARLSTPEGRVSRLLSSALATLRARVQGAEAADPSPVFGARAGRRGQNCGPGLLAA